MSHPSLNSRLARAEQRHPKRLSIREEAREAILVEQLSYLLRHVGSCPEDCPDCTRLRRVEQILLQPFDFSLRSAESVRSCVAALDSTA